MDDIFYIGVTLIGGVYYPLDKTEKTEFVGKLISFLDEDCVLVDAKLKEDIGNCKKS